MLIQIETGKIKYMENEKKITVGILAHVDAGKTTLCEAMLYLSGKIKKLGRVDRRDSYLDGYSLERERGITIFSKQAVIHCGNTELTLLDTPGHVDFSAETERTMPVLDYAVLVISGTDGVQAHTETVWRLLGRYEVPCFIFVTKMDLPGAQRQELMGQLRRGLSDGCIDFSADNAERDEQIAMCDEKAVDAYLESGELSVDIISDMISGRKIFPVLFGSGLRTDGVDGLLEVLDKLTRERSYAEQSAALIYKVARDAQGTRMSFAKVTGGEIKVRDIIKYKAADGTQTEEKITQLRLYSGMKYETADSVPAGQVCAIVGLSGTFPGQGLGAEQDSAAPLLEPVLSYKVILPQGCDARTVLPKLMQLQEEDPQLHIVWDVGAGAICVQLMGKVQTEVFLSLVKERFDIEAALDAGHIMYRETIADRVEGVGHFEPLRHYAEVHLILEPMPRGSGIVADTVCSEDELDRNWQRLILTHILEKQHIGVLTGAPLTDVKITLAAGRAHIKHTEGGDFRQACYRAIRQGLMQAKSVLLEPYYSFSIAVPPEHIGRAISDVRAMNGEFSAPEDDNGLMRIEGTAPVSEMNGYMNEIISYTHGKGRFACRPDGYRPCHNAEKVIAAAGYSPESDLENTPDSVFCAHGSGFNVKWDMVPEYMHLESVLKKSKAAEAPSPILRRSISIDERELEAIMEREFGPIRRPEYRQPVRNEAPEAVNLLSEKKQYIIVDGYNFIFAWDELKSIAADRLDLARHRLMDMLSSYCGYTKAELVLVFDAYRTPGSKGSRSDYHNIHVAYTADGETGDSYIERLAGQIGKNYAVRVVTSDNLIRLSALRSGVLRTSSKEFRGEVEWVLQQIDEILRRTNEGAHMTRLKDGKQ